MPTSRQLKRTIAKLERKLKNTSISVRRFAEIDGQLRALKSQLASQEKFEKEPTAFMRKFLQ